MKRVVKLIRMLAGILLIPAGIFMVFVLFLTVTDYSPALTEKIEIIPPDTGFLLSNQDKEFTFLTWNIGYGGLGKKMDFFYEGGKKVRPEKKEFAEYMEGITRFISSNDSVDFIFIQEADVHSRRSYYMDEVAEISKVLPNRSPLFAKNYDCRFVPVPLDDPMGRVVSGIACFPIYVTGTALRIDLGTRFSWPKQLVMLKRCIMVIRYKLAIAARKDLVIVTLHNSTFDKGGTLRKKELQKLHQFLYAEYSKGNYVIAGGDWNTNPRGFRPESVISGDIAKAIDPALGSTFLPGWRFAFDPSAPSNRDVDMPYQKGKTKTTIIDFYVVSPNVEVESVHTVATGFSFSDHQPVIMKVSLK
jgi:endonuclease/exonuclease/phosphatase family metal-dependent hydrolase